MSDHRTQDKNIFQKIVGFVVVKIRVGFNAVVSIPAKIDDYFTRDRPLYTYTRNQHSGVHIIDSKGFVIMRDAASTIYKKVKALLANHYVRMALVAGVVTAVLLKVGAIAGVLSAVSALGARFAATKVGVMVSVAGNRAQTAFNFVASFVPGVLFALSLVSSVAVVAVTCIRAGAIVTRVKELFSVQEPYVPKVNSPDYYEHYGVKNDDEFFKKYGEVTDAEYLNEYNNKYLNPDILCYLNAPERTTEIEQLCQIYIRNKAECESQRNSAVERINNIRQESLDAKAKPPVEASAEKKHPLSPRL